MSAPCANNARMTLSEYLKTNGIRQTRFAEKMGMSNSYLSQIVSGDRKPSLTLALRIQAETGGAVDLSTFGSPRTATAAE